MTVHLIVQGMSIRAYNDEPFSQVLARRLDLEKLQRLDLTMHLDQKGLERLAGLRKNSQLEFLYELIRMYVLQKKLSL